jgi:hypothetical protein
LFGTPGGLRLCFDLEVVQTSQQPSTSGQSQTTSGGAEKETTETTGTGTTETKGAQTTTTTSTSAGTVDTTVKCSGPSFPVSGIDPATIEDKLHSSSDGQVVWTQEELSLRGKIVGGEFRVIKQP